MANIDFDTTEFLRALRECEEKARKGAKRGMEDCVDELVRISSEITPIDKGILQRSHATQVTETREGVEGKVEYAIREARRRGHFNYALWIHETDYRLGEASLRRPGTSGWSGITYRVGNKFLERPAKGEEEAFLNHIAEEIRRELGEG